MTMMMLLDKSTKSTTLLFRKSKTLHECGGKWLYLKKICGTTKKPLFNHFYSFPLSNASSSAMLSLVWATLYHIFTYLLSSAHERTTKAHSLTSHCLSFNNAEWKHTLSPFLQQSFLSLQFLFPLLHSFTPFIHCQPFANEMKKGHCGEEKRLQRRERRIRRPWPFTVLLVLSFVNISTMICYR